MKYLLTFVIASLLLVTSAYCQVPGYMGKRAYLTLDMNPTPAFFNQNANNVASFNTDGVTRASKIKFLSFNYRPQISFEYLVHRNVAIGISYSRIQTGTIRAYETGPEDIDDFEHSFDDDVMKGMSLGLNVRVFKVSSSASIAPIGIYRNYKVEYATVNTYDDKSASEEFFVNDFKYPIFTFGIGRQTILAKKFVFRYGMEFGYAAVPGNFFFEAPEWTVQEESGYNVHASLFGYYVFSFKLALGPLLF